MAVPLKYNLRNLRLRMGATVMTALGIALTVATAVFIMALLTGLNRAFVSSGEPLNVLVTRKGSDSELMSFMNRDTFATIKFLPGIAREGNEPLASPEMLVGIVLPRRGGTGEVNVVVRGITPMGIKLRPRVKLTEGRWFTPGLREVVVSQSVNRRFEGASPGGKLQFGKGVWTVVGIFDGGGTANDSEIWGDVNQMASDFDRPGYSSALLRAGDPVSADALTKRVSDDQRLHLQGMSEQKYYAGQTSSGAPIKFVGTLVAIIMAIGSCFAAMNTMYAAVAYRSREIATLRVLGFSRPSIVTSFVAESLLLSLIGATVAIILMLPLNGLTTGTQNFATFSEVVFAMKITPGVITGALLFATIMGLIGGVAPAWHAARQNMLTALRD